MQPLPGDPAMNAPSGQPSPESIPNRLRSGSLDNGLGSNTNNGPATNPPPRRMEIPRRREIPRGTTATPTESSPTGPSATTPRTGAVLPPPAPGNVQLNLAGTVSLSQLVEALSRIIDTRFLYSANLAGRQVTVYTPAELPEDAIPILLGSLLKAENLAVVPSEVEGWKRIVDASDMARFAPTGQSEEALRNRGPAAAITQVIPVEHANITSLSNSLKPFLSESANFVTLPENRLIIVTDFAANVRTVAELLRLIDTPRDPGTITFYQTTRRRPASLIEQINSLLGEASGSAPKEFRLFDDAAGGRVIVAATGRQGEQIIELLRQLDTGEDVQTKLYRLDHLSAARLDSLARKLVDGPSDASESDPTPSRLQTTLDQEGNLLIVRAPADVHAILRRLVETLDRPVGRQESPIRFYKLRNAAAGEVLFSLLALQEVTGVSNVAAVAPASALGVGGIPATSVPGTFGTLSPLGITGGTAIGMPFNSGNAGRVRSSAGINANRGLAGGAATTTGTPGGLMPGGMTAGNLGFNNALGGLGTTGLGGAGFVAGGFGTGGLGLSGLGLGGLGGGGVATLPGGARISADAATNSLIVVAPANVQPLYERLIRSLDQRRPQVMIQAEIVAIDTSNNFRLGVEISAGDRDGDSRLFEFTSFGLSEVDPVDGRLTINPALGFNGVLIDPDVADVIVQALSANTRSRVLASPKVLVNDNQTGTLESVTSVPFQSINTINTISTQSLGGEQQAGTVITVTPHINEDDHLQLEFDIEFSTFADGGTAALPPPRQIDRVGSVVTIPDGKTVVVGGLKRVSDIDTFTGVPLLRRVPILRELSSLTTAETQTTSFFLFLKPVILRDSRFRDLQYLSDVELPAATIAGDDPTSAPVLVPCITPPPMAARSTHAVLNHDADHGAVSDWIPHPVPSGWSDHAAANQSVDSLPPAWSDPIPMPSGEMAFPSDPIDAATNAAVPSPPDRAGLSSDPNRFPAVSETSIDEIVPSRPLYGDLPLEPAREMSSPMPAIP